MSNLKIVNLSKSYESNHILKNIQLEVDDHEFLILVGPSGCGKSTLLSIIAGLEKASSGGIEINGIDVTASSPKDRDIAMVFQSYALYPNMTVFGNIAFGLEMKGLSKETIKAKVADVAQILQIEHLLERKPAELSGGQRQRVAMGRAISRDNAHLYLFDEPLSNLDAKLRGEMRVEIKKLHQRLKKTIVYVTHDQIEAMTLADKIAVMQAGEIVQHGTPEEIYNAPNSVFVASFIGSPRMNFISLNPQLENGKLIAKLHAAGHETSLELPEYCKNYADRPILLGIRPEDMSNQESEHSLAIEIAIELVEQTGPDTMVFFKLNNVDCIARCKPSSQLQIGNRVVLFLHLDKMHFFDVERERKIS